MPTRKATQTFHGNATIISFGNEVEQVGKTKLWWTGKKSQQQKYCIADDDMPIVSVDVCTDRECIFLANQDTDNVATTHVPPRHST